MRTAPGKAGRPCPGAFTTPLSDEPGGGPEVGPGRRNFRNSKKTLAFRKRGFFLAGFSSCTGFCLFYRVKMVSIPKPRSTSLWVKTMVLPVFGVMVTTRSFPDTWNSGGLRFAYCGFSWALMTFFQ